MTIKNVFRFAGLAVAAVLLANTAEAAGPFQFFSVTPCRLVDTRGATGLTGGPPLQGGATRSFPITGGTCGVPSTAAAAVLNVVVVAPTGGGHVTIWPFGSSMPLASTINFDP